MGDISQFISMLQQAFGGQMGGGMASPGGNPNFREVMGPAPTPGTSMPPAPPMAQPQQQGGGQMNPMMMNFLRQLMGSQQQNGFGNLGGGGGGGYADGGFNFMPNPISGPGPMQTGTQQGQAWAGGNPAFQEMAGPVGQGGGGMADPNASAYPSGTASTGLNFLQSFPNLNMGSSSGQAAPNGIMPRTTGRAF